MSLHKTTQPQIHCLYSPQSTSLLVQWPGCKLTSEAPKKKRGSPWEVSHRVTSTNARGLMGYTCRTAAAGELTARMNVSAACLLSGTYPDALGIFFLGQSHRVSSNNKSKTAQVLAEIDAAIYRLSLSVCLLAGALLPFPCPLPMPAKTQVPTWGHALSSHLTSFWRYAFGPSSLEKNPK